MDDRVPVCRGLQLPDLKEWHQVAGRRLDALDGLRGLGALIVVVYHSLSRSDWFRAGMHDFEPIGVLGWALTMSPLRVIFDGRPAVMSFFVLSGFVLTRSFWKGRREDWFRYFLRRVLRIYPPVVASAVFAVGMLALRQALTGTGRGLVDLEAAGTSVSKLLSNMGLLGIVHAPLNVVWWSLRWEMWFSFLLPVLLGVLVLLGSGPQRRFRALPASIGVACIVLVGAVPWLRVTFGLSNTTSQAMLYLPMFVVGVALAAYEKEPVGRRWSRRWSAWVLLAVAFTLVAARALFGAMAATRRIDRALATGLSLALPLAGVAILIALLVSWPVAIRAMSARPLVWVGERSYSLYLVHLPLVTTLAVAFGVRGATLWFLALCVVLSLGAMILFYRWVERPSAVLSSRFGRPRRPRDHSSGGAGGGSEAGAGAAVTDRGGSTSSADAVATASA